MCFIVRRANSQNRNRYQSKRIDRHDTLLPNLFIEKEEENKEKSIPALFFVCSFSVFIVCDCCCFLLEIYIMIVYVIRMEYGLHIHENKI